MQEVDNIENNLYRNKANRVEHYDMYDKTLGFHYCDVTDQGQLKQEATRFKS